MTKHDYICRICEVVASKSDCFKRKVGAVFVNRDHEILATGYNAPPSGFLHCDHPGKRRSSEILRHTCGTPCTRNIHAEMNAILQAAKRGTALRGSILYCTYLPCVDCARAIVNLKIYQVYYQFKNEDGGAEILCKGNSPCFNWNDVNSKGK